MVIDIFCYKCIKKTYIRFQRAVATLLVCRGADPALRSGFTGDDVQRRLQVGRQHAEVMCTLHRPGLQNVTHITTQCSSLLQQSNPGEPSYQIQAIGWMFSGNVTQKSDQISKLRKKHIPLERKISDFSISDHATRKCRIEKVVWALTVLSSIYSKLRITRSQVDRQENSSYAIIRVIRSKSCIFRPNGPEKSIRIEQ